MPTSAIFQIEDQLALSKDLHGGFFMCRSMFTGSQSGFTLIELLVTLVLLGLVTTLLGPNVNSWLTSRQAAATRDAIANQLAGLPLKANMRGESIVITDSRQLMPSDINLQITQPIEVLANGFCVGGAFELLHQERVERFLVNQPFCEVQRVP